MAESPRRPKPNQDRWTAVRVQVETRQLLDDLRREWVEWSGQELSRPLDCVGMADTEESTRGEVGYDRVIRRLIALVLDHRARGRGGRRRQ